MSCVVHCPLLISHIELDELFIALPTGDVLTLGWERDKLSNMYHWSTCLILLSLLQGKGSSAFNQNLSSTDLLALRYPVIKNCFLKLVCLWLSAYLSGSNQANNPTELKIEMVTFLHKSTRKTEKISRIIST